MFVLRSYKENLPDKNFPFTQNLPRSGSKPLAAD
jgi:hypothetical protein